MTVLVLIDIQKEYTTRGRAFYLEGIEQSLSNAKRILDFARAQHWNIIHVQHFRNDPNCVDWNANSPFSDFVEGFEPLLGETKVIKNKFSSYSSPEYCAYMNAHAAEALYMIGYNTRMCCLSTAIEGYPRDHHYQLVSDATLAKATVHFSEAKTHIHMLEIIDGVFAKVIHTATVLETQNPS